MSMFWKVFTSLRPLASGGKAAMHHMAEFDTTLSMSLVRAATGPLHRKRCLMLQNLLRARARRGCMVSVTDAPTLKRTPMTSRKGRASSLVWSTMRWCAPLYQGEQYRRHLPKLSASP